MVVWQLQLGRIWSLLSSHPPFSAALDAPAVSLRLLEIGDLLRMQIFIIYLFILHIGHLVSNPHLHASDEPIQQRIYDCQGGTSIDFALKCDRTFQIDGMRTLVFKHHVFVSLSSIPTQN